MLQTWEHGKIFLKRHFSNTAAQSGRCDRNKNSTMKCLEMPEFVGFPNMGILVPYGITFDVVGVFGLAFQLLFKS